MILVGLYWAAHWRNGRMAWAWGGLYTLIWLAVYAGLRLLRGDAAHTMGGISGTLQANLANVPYAFTQQLMLVPLIGLAVWNYRRSSPDVRRYLGVIIAYLGVCAVWALWNEVRLYMTVLPILLVYALSEKV